MIIKPVSRLVQELDARSFTVIGNPCSDGLGVESLQWFRAALAGAEGDFALVLGDVAPIGRDPYYGTAANFIDRTSPKPVHVMRGNHDGPDYEEYFGPSDRAILSDEFVLIMLDNSGRSFSPETLGFLRETMAMIKSRNIIVAFHIPPPNRISGSSLPADEWRRFEEAVGVWRNRITLLLCGHAHSYFEDEIDGLRLVVTGGGGAALREPERVARPPHHALEVTVHDGRPRVRMRPLTRSEAIGVMDDSMHSLLREVFDIQCRHHVSQSLDAETAAEMGLPGLAHLYRAASESSYLQARSLYGLLGRDEFIEGIGADYTISAEDIRLREVLPVHALDAVSRAEQQYAKIHDRLCGGGEAGRDVPGGRYFICDNCGMLFSGQESPNYCASCGAPGSGYREVK